MSVANTVKVVLAGLALGIMVVVAGLALAWPARADPDTDFANELHGYGIYGQKDYNAWIGKITCKRLYNGVDADAFKSAAFVTANLLQLPQSRRGSCSARPSTPTAPSRRRFCNGPPNKGE